MNNLKKFLYTSIGVAILGLLLIGYGQVQGLSRLEVDNQMRTSTSTPVTLSLYSRSAGQSATTTLNATTTFQTIGIDLVDLNIQFKGSSTDATLNWTYQFSDNFMDWYGEDLAQTASARTITHSSTTLVHSWNPEVASTTVVRKNISIEPIASRYMRIIFTTTNATSSVHARVALKSEVNR